MRGTKKGLWLAFSVVAVAVACVSCGTPRMGAVKGMPEEEAIIVDQCVMPNSRAVTSKLLIGGIRSWRDPSGRLNTQVQIVNKSYRDVKFVYYFEWMDDAGFMLSKDTTGWVPEVIYGYGRKEITGVAPSPEASRFRMQINLAD